MNNVPTDRTDDALKNVAVEQPENAAANVEAGAENQNPTSQEVETETVTAQAQTLPEPEAVLVEKPAESAEQSAEAAPTKEVPDAEVATAEVETATPETETKEAETETIEPSGENGDVSDANGEEEKEVEKPKEFTAPDTKEGVIERLKVLNEHAEQSETEELNLLKQTFYRFQREERQQAQNQFLKDGGKPEDFKFEPDPLEDEFKHLMTSVRNQRAKLQAAVEQQKQANLEKKQVIIEKIKALAASPEEANKNYDTFRKLQEEWKEINPIPQQNANEIWKNFQFAVEQFYDLLKENNALRDYDFKKNLEAKTKLCEEAEKLIDNPDIVQAARQLQQLHQEFREIGPVAKDLRESLWERFKAASSAVNKRQAKYFEELKAKEEENLAKKTALCEEIENIETANLKSSKEWEHFTNRIIDIQKQWREIGRATKKMNNKIYERFRAACDNYFAKRNDFFKAQKEIFAQNYAKKQALIEKVEALKDGTEWNSITNKLVQLQKEWKTIGPVSFRVSNALWQKFNGACNYFFERKKEAVGDQQKEEKDNLTAKRTIIDKLEAVAIEGGETAAEKVKALMDEWNATGHVPYKEKDKIYAQYRNIVDKLFKELNLSSLRRGRQQRRNDKAPRRNESAAQQKGRSLYRLYEAKKAELATFENNISFLSSSSKSGNALINSMNKRIESLKTELAALVEKIKAAENADNTDAQTAEVPSENEAQTSSPVEEVAVQDVEEKPSDVKEPTTETDETTSETVPATSDTAQEKSDENLPSPEVEPAPSDVAETPSESEVPSSEPAEAATENEPSVSQNAEAPSESEATESESGESKADESAATKE